MHILKKALLSVSAFALGMASVVGFVAVAFANGDNGSPQPVGTKNLAAAEEAAGYDIVAPGNMPTRMALQLYMVDGNKQNNKAVITEQEWHHEGEGSKKWITVSQGPTPMGLVGGKPTMISGINGERVLYEARASRPYQVLALYWPHDGGHRGVVGSLVDDQTEQTIRAIAASLIPE